MTDRRAAARFRRRLDDLCTTKVSDVAEVIVNVGKGQFTQEEVKAWLQNSTDGQALMASLKEKEQ